MRKLFFLCVLFFCLFIKTTIAQMQVSGIPMMIPGGPTSYTAMVQQLLGSGVAVSNVVINFNTAQAQAGWFTANGTNLGLTQGMLLTSGDINGGPGPNSAMNYSGAVQNGTGDADLNGQVTGFTTNDACIIEFDLVPYCDTLSIKYVFGSDEYEEFVNSIYNDVFAFFISGPNPLGGNYVTKNIALIPGTTTPVSINNVNCNTNNAYYRCNDANSTAFGGICTAANCPANNATTTLQYDGLTSVLTAKSAVVPCQSYHVKIAIADGGGHLLDSGVFLEAGGVTCPSSQLNVAITNGVEGCTPGSFTFNLNSPALSPDTLILQVGGTATLGTDYPANVIPDTLIIPIGASTATINVPISSDAIVDGGETIKIICSYSSACGSQVLVDTFTMILLDPPLVSAGPDKTICSGDTVAIGVNPAFGHSYHWTPSTGIIGGTTTTSTILLSATNNTAVPITLNYVLLDSAGQSTCVGRDTVKIVVNPAVTASFTAPAVCFGTNMVFTNTSSPSIQTTSWNFGDGTNSSQMNTTHLYPAAGNYNVQITATSTLGCVGKSTQAVSVYSKPTADFTAAPVCYGQATQFVDITGTATQWNWNIGSGTPYTTQNVSYIYPNSGTYQVQLIVADANACKDTVSKSVLVYSPPVSAFSVQNQCVYDNLVFQNQSQQGTNTINASAWNFGDSQISFQNSPSHLYGLYGTYTVTLITSDVMGCADTTANQVEVYAKPIAQFATNSACQGMAHQFVNNSTASASNITSSFWSYGDGQNGATLSPTHTYASAGTFNVQLIVQTNHNCRDTLTQSITVFAKPSSQFSVAPVCLGDTSFFVDNSFISPQLQNDTIVAWSWNMGNGTSSFLQNPNHAFSTSGNHNVTLTTTSDKGCSGAITLAAIVHALPNLPITYSDTACFGTDVVLLVAAPIDFVKVNWFHFPSDSLPFYTGNQYELQTISNPHQYYVQAVGLATGCKTPLLEIHADVLPETHQILQVTDSVLFVPDATATFSIQSDIPIVAYSWDFGDNESSTVPGPVHQYLSPNVYDVNVEMIDSNGCVKYLEKAIEVKELYGIQIPSAFSPNGDTHNDVFFVGTYQIAYFRIEIYNRWGESIYYSENPSFQWDGKTKTGKDCPEGVYVYKVKALSTTNKAIEKAGTITIVR